MIDQAKRFEIAILRPLQGLLTISGVAFLLRGLWLWLAGCALGLLYLGVIGSELHPLQTASDLSKGPLEGRAARIESDLLPAEAKRMLVGHACTRVAILIGFSTGLVLWLARGWRWYLALLSCGLRCCSPGPCWGWRSRCCSGLRGRRSRRPEATPLRDARPGRVESDGEMLGVAREVPVGGEDGPVPPYGGCANQEIDRRPCDPCSTATVVRFGGIFVFFGDQRPIIKSPKVLAQSAELHFIPNPAKQLLSDRSQESCPTLANKLREFLPEGFLIRGQLTTAPSKSHRPDGGVHQNHHLRRLRRSAL